MDGPAAPSIRGQLERVMPPGGRARRVVGWGVVAWTAIGGAILLWVLGRVIGRLAGIIPYLVVAGMVVLILNPAVRRLAEAGVPRRLATTVVFLLFVGVVALLIALIVPALIRQGQSLTDSSSKLVRQGGVFAQLSRSTNPLLHRTGDTVLRWLRDHAGTAPDALRTLTDAFLRLAHAGVVLVVGGFLGFLLLLSLPETTRGISALVPPASREKVAPPLAEVRRIVGGYVQARLIVSAAVGALATLGLWAIHMPFWLLLGIIVGVANIIPLLGSWIGGVPVALISLATKPPSFLIVVVVVIVVSHLVDGWILSPIVLKETTNLHPAVVLLAVLLGADLLGFWGILAAIPVAGVIQFGLREWLVPRITAVHPPEGPPVGAAEVPG